MTTILTHPRVEALGWSVYESPLGPLTLIAGGAGLAGLRHPGRGGALDQDAHSPRGLADAVTQLEAYFAGERRSFELHLALQGTGLQLLDAATAAGSIRSDVDARDVLHAMSAIWVLPDEPDWPQRARRLLGLLMDGLRYGA